MEAVIETGGKQYQVSKGQKLKIEKLEAEAGAEIKFDVLAIIGDKNMFGQPLVEGAKVVAKVLSQDKGPKIIVSTYKRRKAYRRTKGHRQKLTQIEISDIQV